MNYEDTIPPQDPPEGFEPQTPLQANQPAGMYVRSSDLIADAEDENPDSQYESDGDADDDDDLDEEDLVSAKKKPAAKKRAAKNNPETPKVDLVKVPVPTRPLDYTPKRSELAASGVDQHEVEAKRQAELSAERESHNRRTGDVSR